MPEAFTYRVLLNHRTTLVGYYPHLVRSRDLHELTKVIYLTEFESRSHSSRDIHIEYQTHTTCSLAVGWNSKGGDVGSAEVSALSVADTIKHSLINS